MFEPIVLKESNRYCRLPQQPFFFSFICSFHSVTLISHMQRVNALQMAYEYNHWFISFKNSDVEKIPPHYLDFAMQNCLLAYAEAKAQISLRI